MEGPDPAALPDLLGPASRGNSPATPAASAGPLSLTAVASGTQLAPPPGPASSSDSEEEQQQEAAARLDELALGSDEEQFEDATSSPSPECEGDGGWITRPKHLFVLSEAGKPIYSLHGEEEMLVSICGLMQAMVSFVADSADTIRCLRTGDTVIVFLVRPPLILVGVSSAGLQPSQLTLQLSYVHSQIVSVLTATQLARIFQQRRNYDLRRMLAGSERLLTSLSASMDTDPSYFLSAVRCLPLAPPTRDCVSETIIRYAGKVPDVVFGILIAENHLVTLVRMKKYFIHPADLHLVFNLINSTESFKHSESWTPLCLPKFDSSGFLHAHVSYLSDTSPACLLLITTDRNAFFSLSEAKAKIEERLERHGVLTSLATALLSSPYTSPSLGLQEIRHFLYKSRSSAQYTAPLHSPCYSEAADRHRLDCVYLAIQNRFLSSGQPLKLCQHTTESESVLGWTTQSFELYAAFPPTLSKLRIITAVNKLLRWVKKEEERLFILTAPTF